MKWIHIYIVIHVDTRNSKVSQDVVRYRLLFSSNYIGYSVLKYFDRFSDRVARMNHYIYMRIRATAHEYVCRFSCEYEQLELYNCIRVAYYIIVEMLCSKYLRI